jgi:sortase A
VKWMTLTAWLLGCTLVLAYIGHRVSIDRSNAAALAEFHREQSRDRALEPIQSPDTSTWSRQRVAAYHKAQQGGTSVVAVLRIAADDLEAPIYKGANERNLNLGAAWIEGTARLGTAGNVGVAGHRDGYFRALRKLRVGDLIEVETLRGSIQYHVTQISIVTPDAVEVLETRAAPTLTLVTCYPFHYVGAAPKRWIAHAERVNDLRAAAR